MRSSSSLVILFGLFAIYSTQAKLQVTILYESLCPDSIHFITQQLEPAYVHLRDYIDLELVPFGKSDSHQNGKRFTCQHGPSECAGNKVQSCALNEIANPDIKMAFIACQMATRDLAGYHCSRTYAVEFSNIMQCYSSDSGKQLQLEAEKRTKQYRPSFVPTIIYNDKFDQYLQDNSLINFLGVACGMLRNAAPICQQQ